jgi:hypothetical protein
VLRFHISPWGSQGRTRRVRSVALANPVSSSGSARSCGYDRGRGIRGGRFAEPVLGSAPRRDFSSPVRLVGAVSRSASPQMAARKHLIHPRENVESRALGILGSAEEGRFRAGERRKGVILRASRRRILSSAGPLARRFRDVAWRTHARPSPGKQRSVFSLDFGCLFIRVSVGEGSVTRRTGPGFWCVVLEKEERPWQRATP